MQLKTKKQQQDCHFILTIFLSRRDATMKRVLTFCLGGGTLSQIEQLVRPVYSFHIELITAYKFGCKLLPCKPNF